MYQWTDAASGTVQLSGTAPAWYRNMTDGPRIFVFDNGELIDDTAVQVPESQRLRLRADAIGHASSVVALAEPDDDDSNELRAAMEKAAGLGIDINAVANEFSEEQATLPVEPNEAPSETSDQASALKALIDAYDLRQLEQARSLIDLLPQSDVPNAPTGSGYWKRNPGFSLKRLASASKNPSSFGSESSSSKRSDSLFGSICNPIPT